MEAEENLILFDYFLRVHEGGSKFYETLLFTVFEEESKDKPKYVEVRRYGAIKYLTKGGSENVLVHDDISTAASSFERIKATKTKPGEYTEKTVVSNDRFAHFKGEVGGGMLSGTEFNAVKDFIRHNFSAKAAGNAAILLDGEDTANLKQRSKPRSKTTSYSSTKSEVVIADEKDWGSW